MLFFLPLFLASCDISSAGFSHLFFVCLSRSLIPLALIKQRSLSGKRVSEREKKKLDSRSSFFFLFRTALQTFVKTSITFATPPIQERTWWLNAVPIVKDSFFR